MTLQTIDKARIEILVDAPLVKLVLDLLSKNDILGYTLFPTLSGQGHSGHWRDDQISQAQQKVMILSVTDQAKAASLSADIAPLLDDYGIILMIGTVAVLRGSKFS